MKYCTFMTKVIYKQIYAFVENLKFEISTVNCKTVTDNENLFLYISESRASDGNMQNIINFITKRVTWNYFYSNICWIMLKLSKAAFPEVFLGKGVLKICSKFTEHAFWNAISIKLQSNFIEITLRHGCSPVSLLHIFRKLLPKNTSGGLLLKSVDTKAK